MAIIQISKLQQRSGNLVDLPQLDEAEFGWASDDKRLFIGKETPNENIEVLTSYSRIDFNQIEGSVGNLNISDTPLAGQVLAYDGTNWVNRGRGANGLLTLGDVGNIKIDGGAIGYVLQTDGIGNVSWAPRGVLYVEILDLSPDSGNALGFGNDAVIMNVANTTPYTNGVGVTITGVEGNANANVNSEVFYLKLTTDYPTSGNVVLFTTQDLDPGNVFVDADLEYDNPPNAIATSLTGGAGGVGSAAGANTNIQYNFNNVLGADADFTWNQDTNVLTVVGNAVISNINSTGTITGSRLVATVATGTSPLLVSSTTVVANLNADRIDGFDASVASSANTVVVRDANGNIAGNTITGNTVVATVGLTGTLTTAAQPNITSVGTLTGLTSSGNITAANIVASTGVFTGNGSGLTNLNATNISTGVLPAGRLSGTYSISITGAAATAATVTTAAQPNITSVGTLTSLAVTGNITAANITASTHIIRSITTGISAAGSTQGTATLLTKDVNVVSVVTIGTGVVLPVAVAGMVIIVNNNGVNALNVYPNTNTTINNLTINSPLEQSPGASLQFYATSPTQWYTLGATYA